MNKFETNLSEGNVVKRLILFSLPFLISNLIQSLYSVTDMLIVGNFSGTASIAAVNIGSQITLIFTQIVVGFCVGGAVLIAQYIGAKNQDAVKKTATTLITSLLVLSVVFTVLMLIFRLPILRLVQTPIESFDEANSYLFVTILGIIFIFGYNAFSAILRGMGDSRRPLYFVAIACILNVGLDLLLVAKFGMGAKGAAIATVLSQAISMILCIIYLKLNDFVFDFRLPSFHICKNTLKIITKIGLPTAVQNGIVGISFLIIIALVNIVGGVNASASVGVVGKFNGFAIMPGLAMSMSVSTMAAQNIGAGQWDRAKKTCKTGLLIAIFFSYSIFVLVQIFPEQILALFDKNPEMIANGVIYLRIFSLNYLITPFVFCLNGLFIGAGHTTFTLINSILSSILLRVPAAAILGITFQMGVKGIGLGVPVASFGALLLIIWFYFSGRWQTNVIEAKARL